MATTRKPAAKSTPAARKPPTRTPRKATPQVESNPLTEEQMQAKLEAYNALKSVGLDIPEELKIVEDWIAQLLAERQAQEAVEAEIQAEIHKVNAAGPWYVRNGYPAPFNLRLDRQTEKRRIELKPRGTPGDMHPLKDEDLKDPVLNQNLHLGLIEIIPAGEAALIIERQTTNMGHRVHTPLAVLRNELGQIYKEGQVKVEAEFNSQGVTVAAVDPRVLQGQLHDREVGGTRGTGGITRVLPGTDIPKTQAYEQATSVVHSAFVPTGGNQAIVQYGPLVNDARAKVTDDLARRKGGEGPKAGLGDVTVTVDPVVKT